MSWPVDPVRRLELRFTSVLVALVISSSALAIPAEAQEQGIMVSRSADGMLTLTGGSSSRRSASGSPTATRRVPPADLSALFAREARRHGLDSKLVEAVAQVESAYDSTALSKKGAMGLMQLMPETASDLGVRDPWDPEQNVSGGTRYLRQMLDRFDGRIEHALAAYNAGPGAVERFGGIPPYRETLDYVRKVLGVYRGEVPSLAPATRRSTGARPSNPIRVARDAQGRLVLTTP